MLISDVEIMKKIQKIIKTWTFRKLLTVIFVAVISVAFLVLATLMTYLSEHKIRENVKENMSVVVEQYNVYLGNYITNIFKGFTSFESNPSLIHLQLSANTETSLSSRANWNLSINKAFYQFLDKNSSSVYSVYTNFNNGRVVQQAYQQNMLTIQYNYEDWVKRFPDNKYYWVDADDCRDLIPDKDVGAVLFHLYSDVNSNRNGILLIAIRKDFFENILDATSLNPNACISLVTDNGIMHFGKDSAAQKVDRYKKYILSKEKGAHEVKSEILDHYFFIYEDTPLTGWKLVYNINESSISNIASVKRDVILLSVIWIIAVSVIIGLLSKAISHPLRNLTETVEKEDVLEHEIAVSSYAEITSLSNSLEKMRDRINLLLQQIELEQKQRSKMEIALVQEQVSPHFLYNTLYACMQLCEMKETEKASNMLEALSNFYRIGLNNGKEIVTVKEEIEHIKNYLFIQHFRYSDVFDYTIDCELEIMSCKIPKMSLQPLVENAIYHGVKLKHEFGNICIICGSSDGINAYLEVHDDGPGMSQDRITEIEKELQNSNEKKSQICFGLKNIDSRIKYEFGQDCGIEIYSEPNDTCVRICFHMIELNEDC